MRGPACLICKHMVPIVPEDWTPAYSGDEYDRYQVRKAIRDTGTHKRIWCALNPTWVEFFTSHHCGQFGHVDGAVGDDMRTFLHGSFAERERDRLLEENAELKRKLERSRTVSGRRLERLKKVRQQALSDQISENSLDNSKST